MVWEDVYWVNLAYVGAIELADMNTAIDLDDS
jgi:hypothetical protein